MGKKDKSPLRKAGILKVTPLNNLQFKNRQDQASAPLSRTELRAAHQVIFFLTNDHDNFLSKKPEQGIFVRSQK